MTYARAMHDEAALAAVVDELKALLGDRLSTSRALLEQHGCTVTWHENQPPDAVVFPCSTDEVASIAQSCAQHGALDDTR